MSADRQHAATDQPGPEQVRISQVEIEVKDSQLVTVRRGMGQLGDSAPASLDRTEQNPERDRSAEHVHHELDKVGPDHRADATGESVNDCCDTEGDDRTVHVDVGNMLQHDRAKEQPEAIAESASDDKQQARGVLHNASEVPVENFVGREQFAGKVPRQQC